MRIVKGLFLGIAVLSIFLLGAAAQEEAAKPVVMFMINEQIWVDETIVYDYCGELAEATNLWTNLSQTATAFTEVFLDRGFTVAASGIASDRLSDLTKDDVITAIEGDDGKSIEMGGRLKADIVIVGKAVAKGKEMLASSRQASAHSNITVRAIKVDTGQIIAVESGGATALDIDEISAGAKAIREAAGPIAASLADKILEKGGSDD